MTRSRFLCKVGGHRPKLIREEEAVDDDTVVFPAEWELVEIAGKEYTFAQDAYGNGVLPTEAFDAVMTAFYEYRESLKRQGIPVEKRNELSGSWWRELWSLIKLRRSRRANASRRDAIYKYLEEARLRVRSYRGVAPQNQPEQDELSFDLGIPDHF